MSRKPFRTLDLTTIMWPLSASAGPRNYNWSQVTPRASVPDADDRVSTDKILQDAYATYRALRGNALSGVHLLSVFKTATYKTVPTSMIDRDCDVSWQEAAKRTIDLLSLFGSYFVSYDCENEGELFVHLTPSDGGDLHSLKSRKSMRGHTDAVAMPFPHEAVGTDEIAPSPDMVILVCMQNPHGTSTRLAPLSKITKLLTKNSLKVLQEQRYDITPQASFQTKRRLNAVPVLYKESLNSGYMCRFSHSNVKPTKSDDEEASEALAELASAIAENFTEVVLNPGDVLLVNNRTAIHGRSEVLSAGSRVAVKRWLLRTYGMHSNPSFFHANKRDPYVLKPQIER